jgi:hypothetical protein
MWRCCERWELLVHGIQCGLTKNKSNAYFFRPCRSEFRNCLLTKTHDAGPLLTAERPNQAKCKVFVCTNVYSSNIFKVVGAWDKTLKGRIWNALCALAPSRLSFPWQLYRKNIGLICVHIKIVASRLHHIFRSFFYHRFHRCFLYPVDLCQWYNKTTNLSSWPWYWFLSNLSSLGQLWNATVSLGFTLIFLWVVCVEQLASVQHQMLGQRHLEPGRSSSTKSFPRSLGKYLEVFWNTKVYT